MNTKEFYQLLIDNDGLLIGYTFDNYISIDFSQLEAYKFNYLEFKDCNFKNGFTIDNFNSYLIVEFKNTTISGLNILRSFFSKLLIDGCEIKTIDLYKIEVTDVAIDCDSNSSLSLDQIKTNSLVTRNKLVCNSIYIDSPDAELIIIECHNFVRNIEVRNVRNLSCSSNFGKIIIISNDFESIDFSSDYKNQDEVLTCITDLEVISDNMKGALLLNGVKIQNLKFTSVLSQSGVLQINNAEIENTSFLDSTFKNIYWNNVSFQKKLQIENSDLSSLKYANIDWIPDTKFSCTDLQFDQVFYNKDDKQEIKENIKLLRNDREVYRQLKSAATSMQNHIDSMEFHRLEMRLYWKDIRFTKSTSLQNRVLVFFDRWVSDFGQNWWLPIIWLFFVHFILFMCIFQWSLSCEIENFKNGLGEYFTLLNPIHKTPDYINTGMGLFTEFWMRALNGFFIYHFVRATRRYGKI